jgi:hypothetical protein
MGTDFGFEDELERAAYSYHTNTHTHTHTHTYTNFSVQLIHTLWDGDDEIAFC